MAETLAQLHLSGFTHDDIETIGRFVGVDDEILQRMVAAAETIERLPRRGAVVLPAGEDRAELHFRFGGAHPQAKTCPGCGKAELDRIAIVDLAYIFETCECDVANYRHLYEQLWHERCLRAAPVDGLEDAFAQLDGVLERIADGWRFDRLEHQHDGSGAWRARAVFTKVHPREIVAEYGRRPDSAVVGLAEKLADRYQVRSVAPTTVGGSDQ